MNILLTGGSGFIGKNLYEGLKDSHTIFTPSHKELDITNYLAVEQFIKEKKIETIIHAAIQGGKNVLETTLRMFLSIYRSKDKVDKIIHFGSGAEYGKNRDLIKVKEEEFGKHTPEDDYGLAKYLCSLLGKNEKKIITLRLFGVYGKYEDYLYKFISNAIVKNLLGLPIKIKQNVVFDYLYIDDLIKVVEFLLKHSSRYIDYNITPTESISLTEIAQTVNKISPKKSEITVVNKGYNYQYTGDNKRLLETIPHCKFTSYKDSIKDLFSYYQQKINSLDKTTIVEDEYFKKAIIKK